MHLRHFPFGSAEACMEAVGQIAAEGSYRGHKADFLDGTAFAPDELYLTVGAYSDVAPWRSDYTGQQIYYQSVRRDKEDFLTIRDYLWRWDTDWFWCSRPFGVQKPLVRRLWPRRYRRSDVYRKLVALDRRYGLSGALTRKRHLPSREAVIQDVEIPVERGAEFLRYFAANVGMSPVWMCPLRLRGERTWPLYPLKPGEVYVNFGFWGTVPLPAGQAGRLLQPPRRGRGLPAGRAQVAVLHVVLRRGRVLQALQRRGVPRRSSAPTTARAACSACTRSASGDADPKGTDAMALAEVFEAFAGPEAPVEFTAYDGSHAGTAGSPVKITVRSPAAVAYLAQAPGELGLARAYVAGQLDVEGDMYEALARMTKAQSISMSMAEKLRLLQALGGPKLLVHRMPPPPQEVTQTRRWLAGRLHSKSRDAKAISHHYDVSNRFYEWVLGPSMAYTCACYPREDATLEEAQANKFDLVARKLGLREGMRLLDVGCGWGGMVMHAAREYGVKALGVTLSAQQAAWAQAAIEREGLSKLAEVRHLDYRDVPETGFDAVSSIGLTEHVGKRTCRPTSRSCTGS